jgi:hypothetical protein
MEEAQVPIYSLQGKRLVYSFEFYNAIALRRCNYTRWMMNTVFDVGRVGVDFFPAPENVAGRTIRFRLRYYFDLDFAISLCLVAKRKEAQGLRKYLMGVKNNEIPASMHSIPITHEKAPKHTIGVIKSDLQGKIIKEYNSLKEASIDSGISHQHIYYACFRVDGEYGGFKWRYV